MRWTRVLCVWLGIVVAESVHGVLRQIFLVPRIGDLAARQWGVLTGSLIILVVAVASDRWIGAHSTGDRLRVGALWTVLILCFEVGLGRALGSSWDRILSDYDLTRGGYMLLGLLVLLLSPVLAGAIKARLGQPTH